MQGLRGLISAVITGGVVFLFLSVWMHGPQIVAFGASGMLGAAVLAVVGTRGDERGVAADAAWREASPDLPPLSDRVALERDQASIAAPPKPRKPAAATPAGERPAPERSAAVQPAPERPADRTASEPAPRVR